MGMKNVHVIKIKFGKINRQKGDDITMWSSSVKGHIDKYLKSVDVKIITEIARERDLTRIMEYNREFNKIKINNNARWIHKNAEVVNMKIEDFLIVCAAYQIGHSLNNRGIGRSEREKHAYLLGKTFVPKELMKEYIKVNRRSGL